MFCKKGPGLFCYMALHATAFDGKKEVALEVVSWPLGSRGSGCTVFPGSSRRFAVPFLFEGIITRLPVNIAAFKRVKQRKRGCGSWSERSNDHIHFLLLCLVSVFKELSCQQDSWRLGSSALEERPRPSGLLEDQSTSSAIKSACS